MNTTEGTDNQAHALFAPSAAYRNASCVGSLKIVKEAEKLGLIKSSKFAEWGTMCHEYAADALRTIHTQNHYDFNKILDPEKLEVVQGYVAFVGEVSKNFRKTHSGVKHYIEFKVMHDKDFWGTADFILTGHDKKTKEFNAVFIDLKAGAGVEVLAEDNEQLLSYIVCLQTQLETKIDNAHCFIYQPRTGGESPYLRWSINHDIIVQAATNLIINKRDCIDHLQNGKLGERCQAGDWCRFCPGKEYHQGKPLCTAYAEEANASKLKILDAIPEVPAIDTLSIQQKFEIFKRRKMIKKILDDACKDVLLAANKEKFEGYKIVNKAGRRSWKKGDVDEMAASLIEKGFENPIKKSLVAFGEVEKKLGKGTIDELLEPGKTSYELVPEEDKRQEIQQIGLDEIEEIDFDSIE